MNSSQQSEEMFHSASVMKNLKPVKLHDSLVSPSIPHPYWPVFDHRVQSAQQFQALQAQYSALNPHPQFQHPEGHGATPHMAHPEAMMDQQEPANLAKGTGSFRGKGPDSPAELDQLFMERRKIIIWLSEIIWGLWCQTHQNNIHCSHDRDAFPSLSVAPAKKRGRAAQPKEPKPPKVPKAPKPPKDPNAPKAKPGPKPKKVAEAPADAKQEKIDESFKKVKRKVDRFKGMSEEEVMKKTLPDLLDYNLDYVIVRFFIHLFPTGTENCGMDLTKLLLFCFQIGINPGLMAAYIGRWFPGPGNHFCELWQKRLQAKEVMICVHLLVCSRIIQKCHYWVRPSVQLPADPAEHPGQASQLFLKLLDMNVWCLVPFREVPVSIWIHWGAAQPHARHRPACQIQNGLHQHGGQGNARQQRPVKVSQGPDSSAASAALLGGVGVSCWRQDFLLHLHSKELREGGKILVEKLKKFKPLIAVFNGKCENCSTPQ